MSRMSLNRAASEGKGATTGSITTSCCWPTRKPFRCSPMIGKRAAAPSSDRAPEGPQPARNGPIANARAGPVAPGT
jgi:hypothetical protein